MSSFKSTTRPPSLDRLLCGFSMCTEHGSADVMSFDISSWLSNEGRQSDPKLAHDECGGCAMSGRGGGWISSEPLLRPRAGSPMPVRPARTSRLGL